MVALSNELTSTEILPLDDGITHIESIKLDAAGKGHNKWKKEQEAAGFVAGYPDNKGNKIRAGLVPFDVIEGIRKAIKGRDFILVDDATVERCALLFLTEARNGNIKLDKNSNELVKSASKKDPKALTVFKEWMFALTDDWYYRNFNWANAAERITKKVAEISSSNLENPNEEFFLLLNHLKRLFEDIDNTNDFKELVRKLKVLKIDQEHNVSDLIISIHTGWRAWVKKRDVKVGSLDIVTTLESLDPVTQANLRDFKRMILNLVTYNNVDEAKLSQMVKNNIDAHREKIDSSPFRNGTISFVLMIRLGEEIYKVLSENPQLSPKARSALNSGIEYLAETIKQDVDSGLIDIIIKEYKNED